MSRHPLTELADADDELVHGIKHPGRAIVGTILATIALWGVIWLVVEGIF